MLPPRPRIQLFDPPAASSSQLPPLLDAIEDRSGSCGAFSQPGEGGGAAADDDDEVEGRGPVVLRWLSELLRDGGLSGGDRARDISSSKNESVLLRAGSRRPSASALAANDEPLLTGDVLGNAPNSSTAAAPWWLLAALIQLSVRALAPGTDGRPTLRPKSSGAGSRNFSKTLLALERPPVPTLPAFHPVCQLAPPPVSLPPPLRAASPPKKPHSRPSRGEGSGAMRWSPYADSV